MLRVAAGSALCAALAVGVPRQDPAARAAHSWLDGDTKATVDALTGMPPSRTRDFDVAVVRLYEGDAAAAESAFAALHAREQSWLPAIRWLARAQRELGRPEAAETAALLVRHPDATASDQFWAGGLWDARNDLARARSAFARATELEPDLYPAWVGLARAEASLGHSDAARAAQAMADGLFPGAALPSAAPPLPEGALRYRAKYLFLVLADVVIAAGPTTVQGRPARGLTLEARSAGAGRLFRIQSRYESWFDRDGRLLGHRNSSDDSAGEGNQTASEIDTDAGVACSRRVRGGLFLYERRTLPAGARPQDGLALIETARAVARAGGEHAVLRFADAAWKGTAIRAIGRERIRWQGRDVETVCVEIGLRSRGTAGVQGRVRVWISADDRAIPYRARVSMAIGSVWIELAREGAAGSVRN